MDESEVVARVWGCFAAFFCGVLAHIAALCILVFMPLQRSDAFVEADESGADTWIQGFFAALFGGFFCPPRGGPLHHVCTPVRLAWCCYWVTDRHALFAGGWHSLKKKNT